MNSTILHGDCIEAMQGMPENSVHAIVTDPPYGLGFMGKKWDDLPPGPEWAEQCLRVLKPGGHLLAFGGTRTWHRLAVAIEDAGFEMRDSIAWLYGSGFPKSLDVSKAIDRAAGAKREVVGSKLGLPGYHLHAHDSGGAAYGAGLSNSTEASRLVSSQITAPATADAQQWEGWGTALKPAFEPIVMARKPLIGTVAANVLEHGTGALNIAATRIVTTDDLNGGAYAEVGGRSESASLRAGSGMNVPGKTVGREFEQPSGRWPANVILDESQAAALDAQSGITKSPPVGSVTKTKPRHSGSMSGGFNHSPEGMENGYGDSGGASRYFYVTKAPKRERPVVDGVAHATVKPLTLMRYLVRMITPPGGVVLEPFAGSGTTVEACLLEGFDCIAIEREAEYLPLIQARVERAAEVAA